MGTPELFAVLRERAQPKLRRHHCFKPGWCSALGAAVIPNRINVLAKPV